MPQPHFRTRSRKRQKSKSSGGSNLTSYEKDKTAAPSSLICGKPLVGFHILHGQKYASLTEAKKNVALARRTNVLQLPQRVVETAYKETLITIFEAN